MRYFILLSLFILGLSANVNLKELLIYGVTSESKNGELNLKVHYFSNSGTNFKNPKKFIEITPKIDFKIQRDSYGFYKKINKYTDSIILKGKFLPNQEYKIKFKKGLLTYRNILKKDISFSVKTGNIKPFVEFIDKKSRISNIGELKLNSINLEKTKVVIDRLLDDNYRYFVNFSKANRYDFDKFSKKLSSFEFKIPSKKNQFQNSSLNISKFAKESGIYKISLYPIDNKNNKKAYAHKIVTISDIAITAKVSNNQIFIMTNSLKNTKSLKDVKIKIYSKNNSLILEGKTNSDGVFIREINNLIDNNLVAIIAESKNDENFLIINPYKTKVIKNSYKALIFLERKIYRPNDELNFAINIKNEKFESLADKPIKIIIKDSGRKEILNEVIKTNELGIIDKKFDILNFFKTGRYLIEVYFANRQIGYEEFFVEDFIPQQIKTIIKLNKKDYVLNEPINVKANSEYLIGVKAKNLKAEAKLNAQKSKFKYKNFSFDSEDKNREFNFKEISKKFTLDKDGKANLNFNAKIIGKPTSILTGLLGVTVFDGGRGVSVYKKFNIYPFKEMFGIKRDSKTNSDINKDEIFQTILLNPITKEEIKREIEVEIKKVIWNYNYVDGYNWSKSLESIKKFKINSGDEFKFSAKSSGEYIVTLKDKITNHQASVKYSVYGFDYQPINPRSSIKKLKLNFEDREYKTGEKVKININSPISGKLLLTFESDKIFKYKFFDLKTNSTTIEMDLDFIFKKGFYINGYIIRGSTIDDKTLPFRAYERKYLKADNSKYRVDVKLNHNKKIKSKSKLNIELKIDTNKDAYAIISIVDEGILQILSEKIINPYEFFYTKAQKRVTQFDFYDDILSSFIKDARLKFGGDMMKMSMMSRKKHLAPKPINKRVRPFSIFKIVKVSNGRVNFDIDIPNFNGKAKIIAFIVTKDSVGINSSSFIIKDEIIIKPTYPKFLVVGDKLNIPIKIFNDSNKELKFNITTKNISAKIVKNSKENLILNIEALKEGEGYIKIESNGYYSDIFIPIHTDKTLISQRFIGESNKKIIFNLDKNLINPKVNIDISNSYLKSLKGEFNYLVNYPYGCLEQSTSKLLTLLNLEKFIDANESVKKVLLKERDIFIKNGILKLYDMQLYSGEFLYWEGGKTINKFASIYAIDVLLTLQNRGYDLPKEMKKRIFKYLNSTIKKPDSKNLAFYSLWILTREEKSKESDINMAYDSKSYQNSLILSAFMIDILYQKGFINEANYILSELNNFNLNSMSKLREYGDNFYSKLRDIAFAYSILSKNYRDEIISKRLFKYLKKEIDKKNFHSTQERTFIFRALSEHYKSLKDDNISTLIEFNNKIKLIDKVVEIEDNLTTDIVLNPKKGTFVNYSIDIYANAKTPLKNEIKLPFYAKREFLNENGTLANLNNLIKGDIIYLKMSLDSKEKIKNTLIVNKIPSCLEIINTRINKFRTLFKDKNYKPDFVDIRDDRVISVLTLDKNIEFYLPLRVSFKGECQIREVNLEAMYDESINAYLKQIESVRVK